MQARAPGSVTGLFVPASDGEAARGASFATEDGVVVDVVPADGTAVTVEGDPAPFDPVERVLADLGLTARVDVRPEVPLGRGFGASGAATLATALAAGAEFGLGRSRAELLDAAHRAERAAGTGQGDVFIQDRGGFLYSTGDGTGRVVPDEPVEYASVGGIDTGETLADAALMERFREHGDRELSDLSDPPSLRELAERSWRLVRETGLATDFVEHQVERVRAAEGAASMALFGDTVFAVGVEGVLDHRTTVAGEGARVIDADVGA